MGRLVVFMDWQNVYKRARECFYGQDDPDFTHGQVWPHSLAQLLCDRVSDHGDTDFEVAEIRVYRGAPKNDEDPKGYSAFQRQTSRWVSHNNRVTLIKRDLVYPKSRTADGVWERNDQPAREKGVDVSLAVDVVTMGTSGQYDHAVVFSSDQDLAPAIEFLARRNDRDPTLPGVSVAAWDGGSRLRAQGIRVMCHWIKAEDFQSLVDDRDYTIASSAKQGAPRPGPMG